MALRVVHIDRDELERRQQVTMLAKILRAKWEARDEINAKEFKRKLSKNQNTLIK